MTDGGAVLGDTTFDVYLNDRAYWRNVPAELHGPIRSVARAPHIANLLYT